MEHNKAFVEAIVNRMKTVLGVESDTDAAKILGGTRSMLSLWKNRGSVPFQQCIEMAEKHNISLDWLVLGRGSKEVATADAVQPISDLYVEVEHFDAATLYAENGKLTSWTLPRTWLEQQGLEAASTWVVRAAGDSMAPTITDGQLVIVDRRVKDVDGVYLVDTGKSTRFRRLQRMMDGSIRLLCDNPAYAPDTIPAGDVLAFDPVGYCHSVIKLLR
ncbi:LexA family transcriptional regulator [Massilia dura]|uniref:LexA family transcriptional regulator n=1 Tax=Pseudoduganella dura TaxID=321982 RepID=A0A6I3X3X7_9BURK|nr:LexA family transcriptional regulator [Pseudoduganella dura]MUI10927.1 LexA family transcriptional regulator [Pseudoduganella dura]GGY12769.1 hypothetical protein GCM10007386_48860 [Pseudoduganella dura]